MLRVIILSVAVLALLSGGADARLWETKREIERRYGPSIQTLAQEPRQQGFVYQYKHLFVIVQFLDGKSNYEVYFPVDMKSKLTAKDIQVLLDLNSFGRRWSKSMSDMWELAGAGPKGEKLVAVYFADFDAVDKFGVKFTTPALAVGSARGLKQ